jgi:hypothetical protein
MAPLHIFLSDIYPPFLIYISYASLLPSQASKKMKLLQINMIQNIDSKLNMSTNKVLPKNNLHMRFNQIPILLEYLSLMTLLIWDFLKQHDIRNSWIQKRKMQHIIKYEFHHLPMKEVYIMDVKRNTYFQNQVKSNNECYF